MLRFALLSSLLFLQGCAWCAVNVDNVEVEAEDTEIAPDVDIPTIPQDPIDKTMARRDKTAAGFP